MHAPRLIAPRLLALLLSASASFAFAAPADYTVVDTSNEALMDSATAKALFKEHIPLKVKRLYPTGKWGFQSQVEGGFDDAKTCIVTARATLLPKGVRALVLKPEKSAAAYGTKGGATAQQCKDLGRAKLVEAIEAVRTSMLPN